MGTARHLPRSFDPQRYRHMEDEEDEEATSRSIWITQGRKHGFALDVEWTLDGWIKGPLPPLPPPQDSGVVPLIMQANGNVLFGYSTSMNNRIGCYEANSDCFYPCECHNRSSTTKTAPSLSEPS